MEENLARIGMKVKLHSFAEIDDLQKTLVGKTLLVSRIISNKFICVAFRGNDVKWPVAAIECKEILQCQKS